MLITKEIEIDMAHRVPNHKSKCRNLHWHRYKIEVWVNDKIIEEEWRSDQWMVIDFWDLKDIMMNYIDNMFDHWAVFYEDDKYLPYLLEMIKLWDQNPDKLHFVNFIPTAENLCKHWFELIEAPLRGLWITIAHVRVWETPTSTAIYTVENKNEENKNEEEKRKEEETKICSRCWKKVLKTDNWWYSFCSSCISVEDIPF